MKNISKIIAASFFVVPFVFLQAVSAETKVVQNPTTTTTETQTPQLTDQQKAELKQRVEKMKLNLKTRLNATEKKRVQDKCKAAQGSVSSISGRVKGIETSRSQVYANLIQRLNELSNRLKEKGLDTTELEKQLVTLQTLVDTFNTDLAVYKSALIDLSAQDCTTDPEGFKAALETARAAGKKVRDDAAAIRTHVNDVIKPTVKAIRDTLDKEEGGTE